MSTLSRLYQDVVHCRNELAYAAKLAEDNPSDFANVNLFCAETMLFEAKERLRVEEESRTAWS
jgi:hypothetical protein